MQPASPPPAKSGNKLILIVVAALAVLGLLGVGLWAMFGNKNPSPTPTSQPTFTVPAQPTGGPTQAPPTTAPTKAPTKAPTPGPQTGSDVADVGNGIKVAVPSGWKAETGNNNVMLTGPDGSAIVLQSAAQVADDPSKIATDIRDSYAKKLTAVKLGEPKKVDLDPKLSAASAAAQGTYTDANGSFQIVVSVLVSVHTANHTGLAIAVLAEPSNLEALKPVIQMVAGSAIQSQLGG